MDSAKAKIKVTGGPPRPVKERKRIDAGYGDYEAQGRDDTVPPQALRCSTHWFPTAPAP